jgi:hypothetical protein
MAAKRDVVENGRDGIVIPRSPFQSMLMEMAQRALIDSQEGRVNEATFNAMALAESMDELWDSDEKVSINAQDMVEKEMEVHRFFVRTGKLGEMDENGRKIENEFRNESGVGMYLDVEAIDLSNGEEILFNTSAKFIVNKLWHAERLGAFPLQCVIKGIPLGAGQTVLKLRPIPKRAVQSQAF